MEITIDSKIQNSINHLSKEEQVEYIHELINIGFSITNSWKVKPNSFINTFRGRIEENSIWNIIQNNFSTDLIEDTSGKTAAMDMSLTCPSCTVGIEVKSYSTTVPQREVDKFYRDLDKYHAGLFISCTSGIYNKENTNVEYYQNKPCIFICTKDENVIVSCIMMLKQLVNKNKEIDNSFIEPLIKQFNQHVHTIDQLGKSSREIRKQADDMNKVTRQLVLDLKNNITETLKCLE